MWGENPICALSSEKSVAISNAQYQFYGFQTTFMLHTKIYWQKLCLTVNLSIFFLSKSKTQNLVVYNLKVQFPSKNKLLGQRPLATLRNLNLWKISLTISPNQSQDIVHNCLI